MVRTLALVAGLLCATSASAIQLVLAPSNVVGSSGAYSTSYSADKILDRQTTAPADTVGQYWVAQDSSSVSRFFITIDLGASYTLESLSFFNTHNGSSNDRGTGNFIILASNSVNTVGPGNFAVPVGSTQILSGTLTAAAGVPVAQSFAITDTNAFRYLSFEPRSVAVPGSPFSATSYGLNELRVFVSEVPEIHQWAMLLVGFVFLGCLTRLNPGTVRLK